jgi:DNA-binding winged helix-turn-helix (wHTH) protein
MKSFRGYRLDTVNHCLWRGDERLSLAPKAFDVLRYLVEHADRLVTQDEILEALWPATYVNPEVVKKYVLGIRKVLGDDSAKPVFVATFPAPRLSVHRRDGRRNANPIAQGNR